VLTAFLRSAAALARSDAIFFHDFFPYRTNQRYTLFTPHSPDDVAILSALDTILI